MTILEWFDPSNKDHLRGFKTLVDTGTWPEGFVPEDVSFPVLWHVTLMGVLANEYLEIKLKEDK